MVAFAGMAISLPINERGATTARLRKEFCLRQHPAVNYSPSTSTVNRHVSPSIGLKKTASNVALEV
jgi:hypothetical protein